MSDRKRKYLINQIDKITKESFSSDQKHITRTILANTSDENLDSVYSLLSQRVKTGFVFDASPEVNHNCVSIINDEDKLFIDSKNNPVEYVEHKLLIGENYDALKNLMVTHIDVETAKGLIDIIYIDPPYHTESAKTDGNDYKDDVASSKFVYRDKFTRDGWLNLLNERLQMSRKLLADDGFIVVSIDDREQAYLKVLCDEIFGESNFISVFPRVTKKSGKQHSGDISKNHDYLLLYAKNKKICEIQGIDGLDKAYKYEDEFLESRGKYKLNQTIDYDSLYYNTSMDFPVEVEGKTFYPGGSYDNHMKRHSGEHNNMDWVWRWSMPKFKFAMENGFIVVKNGKRLYSKTYGKATIGKTKKGEYFIEEITRQKNLSSLEFVENKYSNDNGTKDLNKIIGKNLFEYTKPVSLLKTIIKMHPSKNTRILDFFEGSGTTGQAVMELNEEDKGKREFILVTNNENNIALNVTRERLFRVINGEGTSKQEVEWNYNNSKSYLDNNKVRVFVMKYHELGLNDIEKANNLIEVSVSQFKKLNNDFYLKNTLDIYNELSSLNPLRDDENGAN